MKKSLLCVLLCILMLLPLLVACGGDKPPAPPEGQRPDAPEGGPAATLFASAALEISCEPAIELDEMGILAASCAQDGYLYYTKRVADGKTVLCRRDLLTDGTTTEGPALDLGDAVSMCYNTAESTLVVAHGSKTLSVLDPSTLELISTSEAEGVVECITYLEGEDCYATRLEGKRNLVLLDDSFAQIRIQSLPAAAAESNIIDLCTDGEYIYLLTDSESISGNKRYASVIMYHMESKDCLKNVFSFDTRSRTPVSITYNGADFIVATTGYVYSDTFFSGALTARTGEEKPYDILSRILTTGVDSEGITAEVLFKTYKLTSLGDNNVMQGGCTDGKYGYFCMEDQAGNYEETSLHRTCIVKVDMATGELVDVSERLPLHHSNDMCYNPKTNQLMVVHCGKGDASRGLTYVDPDSLEITGTASLPIGFYCMAYDAVNDRYMVGSNGRNFSILDSDFNVLVPKVNVGAAGYCKEEELITQGSDCDSEYVYVVLGGRNSSGPWVNYLVVYDWNGKLIMAKIIPDMTAESENIFHIGSTIYVACNGGDDPVYKIEIEK